MNRFRAIVAFGSLLLLAACGPDPAPTGDGKGGAPAEPSISFLTAAHLVPGDGSAAIDDAIFVVDGGKLTQIGKKGDFPPPKGSGRTDLEEQVGTPSATVIPALINLSAYPGLSIGQSFSADNYKAESVSADLRRYEYYGVVAVASGGADTGDVAFKMRDDIKSGAAKGAMYFTAGQGITAKGGYPSDILKGVPIQVGSEDEARKAVNDLAAKKVDFIKIFVNGSPKLSPALYQAILDEAKKANLKVFADAPALADAKGLVDAGVTALVNSISDGNVDDALLASMKEKGVFYAPALTALEAKFIYADQPEWLRAQFMKEVYPVQLSAYLADAVVVNKFRRDKGLGALRAQYTTAQKNLKKLADGGVKIALGTGSGSADTFPGFFEHRELELMVAAGMSPADALKAGTAGAEALGLADMGPLVMGKAGNFIVTANNPVAKITDTTTAQQIYVKGERIEQGALINDIHIEVQKITKADRAADAAANAADLEERRVAAMTKYGPWPLGTSVATGGLSVPTPYKSTSSLQAGSPARITVNYKGSAADWRDFYGAALRAWKPAGQCWERQNPVSKKTASLCLEPGASATVVTITEK